MTRKASPSITNQCHRGGHEAAAQLLHAHVAHGADAMATGAMATRSNKSRCGIHGSFWQSLECHLPSWKTVVDDFCAAQVAAAQAATATGAAAGTPSTPSTPGSSERCLVQKDFMPRQAAAWPLHVECSSGEARLPAQAHALHCTAETASSCCSLRGRHVRKICQQLRCVAPRQCDAHAVADLRETHDQEL